MKRTKVSDFQNIRNNGIRAVSLRDGDELHSVKLTDGNRDVIIGASNGKAIRFNEQDVRYMGRNAAGVKGISLESNESVIGVTTVTEDRLEVLAITQYGYGKRTDVDEYRLQGRGGKGVKTINVTAKNGHLKKLISVQGSEDLLVVTDKGMIIRVPIDQIAQTKRATQGVRIINLLEGHEVATIAIIPKDETCDDYLERPEEAPCIQEADIVVETPTDFKLDEYKHLSGDSKDDIDLAEEEDTESENIDAIDAMLEDRY